MSGPLTGIRVFDMSWMWAGPYCSLQLAQLGAEVIKVESSDHPDMNRIVQPFAEGVSGLNRGGSFNQWNQGKRSFLIDLKKPGALDLAREVAATCDVFVENFAVGVVQRLGLGWDVMSKLNPRLVMASLSGFGTTGPYRERTAFGNTLAMISGLSTLTGYEGGPPSAVGISYADPNAGLHGTFAILAALWKREQTGVGQYIDVSLWEALMAVMPEGILPFTMRGEQLPRMGNRDVQLAPHGIYRAAGEDEWVSISVRNEDEWRRLANAIDPALVDDARFGTAEARKQNEDELNGVISAWTSTRDRWQIAEQLQAAGVAAVPVMDMKDIAEDPHLNERGFFVQLEHPEIGRMKHAGIPWKLHGTPVAFEEPAPCMGEDNEYIITQLLGRSREEYDRLAAEGVLS